MEYNKLNTSSIKEINIMIVYDKKDNYYIMAWQVYDPNKLYNDGYKLRPENYFDPRIPDIRKKMINTYSSVDRSFDYGCGQRPLDGTLSRYDKYVTDFSYFDYGRFMESEMICVFDVVEHMYDPISFLMTLPQKYVLMTVPVVPYNIFNSLDQIRGGWKHFKPGEHLVYANENGWKNIIEQSRWNIEYYGTDECPPREDVLSFILVR